MALARFSRRAEADLLSIARYTMQQWGSAQVVRYLDDLEACCQALADNPGIGHSCDGIRPGLQRFEHASHVVFYRVEAGGILVSRVLHGHMLPQRHPLED